MCDDKLVKKCGQGLSECMCCRNREGRDICNISENEERLVNFRTARTHLLKCISRAANEKVFNYRKLGGKKNWRM